MNASVVTVLGWYRIEYLPIVSLYLPLYPLRSIQHARLQVECSPRYRSRRLHPKRQHSRVWHRRVTCDYMKAKLVSAVTRVQFSTCNVLQVVWKLISAPKAGIQC
jgi:hypothetical protein